MWYIYIVQKEYKKLKTMQTKMGFSQLGCRTENEKDVVLVLRCGFSVS